MLRHVFALALCASALAALETPLTLVTAQGNRVVLVDPAYGSISIYEISADSADRQSGLRKPQANFLADMELRLKSYADEREGVPLQNLRLGQGTKPLYGEMFTQLMSDKPTRSEALAGKKALRWRSLRAEDAFWKDEVAYDGVVRAAISGSGQQLLLGIPSLHTLLYYRVDGDAVLLCGVRNYGPELFITGLNTSPSPKELLQDVLKRISKDREEEARRALGIEDEAKPGDAPTPPIGEGALAAEEPPTPKSDLWIGQGGSNESFVVVDTINSRAMLYRCEKELILSAVRDLKVDLVVPGLVGGSLRSAPASEELIKGFLDQRKTYIAEYGLPTDRDEILLLVGQRQAKGKPSPFEALSSSAATGITMLNFVDRRVFLTLESKGGQQLNLAAARDYNLDVAVTLMDQEIQDRAYAKALLGNVARLASETKRKSALLTLRQALNLDPRLHKEAETKLKSSFKSDADQQAQYLALLDEATKKAEALAKEAEERKKALEEKKNKKPKAP